MTLKLIKITKAVVTLVLAGSEVLRLNENEMQKLHRS